METALALVTVSAAEALIAPAVAVMSVFPAINPEPSPAPTLATVGTDEVQATTEVTS
ncbi:MAG TPA: hypothetical protein VGR48_04725 [Terriglobales bacterium]|nr:hypothetical protein [Terriglobales bacterium]